MNPHAVPTPRQIRLQKRRAIYRCEQYDDRPYTWDGYKVSKEEELAHGQGLRGRMRPTQPPPPLAQRRPSVQYALCRAIVKRFTRLLFSARSHPSFNHVDSRVALACEAVAREVGLWAHMTKARNYGGSQGTAITVFRLYGSQMVLEALEPTWCTPTWAVEATQTVDTLEIRYQFEKTVLGDNGYPRKVPHWYRRTINSIQDIVYHEEPVEDKEPRWRIDELKSAYHGFGFCPVIWSKNIDDDDDIDGDHDFYGVEPFQERIDVLLSQSDRGTVANCDPTLVVNSDEPASSFTTGSSHTIKVGPMDKVNLLEMTGAGSKTALETVSVFRRYSLEIAQCVLDTDTGDRATATEVIRSDSPMRLAADDLREQYAKAHVVPLVCALLRAYWVIEGEPARDIDGVEVRLNGRRTVQTVKAVNDEDLAAVYAVPAALRKLTSAPSVAWPPYGDPVLDESHKAVDAVRLATEAALISPERGARFLAPYLRVNDPETLVAEVAELQKAKAAREAAEKRAGAAGKV